MTRGERVLDLLSGASGMLVGGELGELGELGEAMGDVALGDFAVEDELEEDKEKVEVAVVDEVADGSGTSVPLTLCFVPMKTNNMLIWVGLVTERNITSSECLSFFF